MHFKRIGALFEDVYRNLAAYSLIVLIFIALPVFLIVEKRRQSLIQRVMSGPIRGDLKSKRFVIPDCPKFDDIPEEDLVIFRTVYEAEQAGYRFTRYCDDEILTIRTINESGETPEATYPEDPQYR